MFNNFFPENRAICEIMSENTVEPERPQMTTHYGACLLHTGQAKLHARTFMHTPNCPGTHTHRKI
jgi:hypothetical protein